MQRRNELAPIVSPLRIHSVTFTILDGTKRLVEYTIHLSQGVNNEWRNLFLTAWDAVTAPTVSCPEEIRDLATPRVHVGSVTMQAVITFTCTMDLFAQVAGVVRHCVETASDRYLNTLGLSAPLPTSLEEAISESIRLFLEDLGEPPPEEDPAQHTVLPEKPQEGENAPKETPQETAPNP